jgi:TolA-binding protein
MNRAGYRAVLSLPWQARPTVAFSSWNGLVQCRDRAAVESGLRGRLFTALVMLWLVGPVGWAQDRGADKPPSSEAALAIYADAANYQNNGAFDLAVTEWQKFLSRHADDPLAPKAAHYLGVCLMQKDPADVREAAEAFAKALRQPDPELREETLANRGWCLYTQATESEGGERTAALRETLQTYAQLLREFPQAQLQDQALFYSGEAATALEQYAEAADFYERLLKLPKPSSLRCQSVYAVGFAREQLDQLDRALAAYEQLLRDCPESPLANDARVRIGDVLIRQEKFDQAVAMLRQAIDGGGSLTDYALYRCAYALVKQDKLSDAAELYDRLSRDFADSPYASSAQLAAAQASYRAGDYESAEAGFRKLLASGPPETRIEAAHWICQILQRNGKVADAATLAEQTLKIDAPDTPLRLALELDLADALAVIPDRGQEALKRYQAIARRAPDDPSAPRAVYGACFTALQVGNLQLAEQLAAEFLKRYRNDPLVPDVGYVAAEAQLRGGSPAAAADSYERLLKGAPDHPSRGMWWLRWATARYQAGDYQRVITDLPAQLKNLNTPTQRAEAHLLIGSSCLEAEQFADAAKAFEVALKSDPEFAGREEAQLLLGQAQLRAGNRGAAARTWQQLDAKGTTTAAVQGRLRLAQLKSQLGEVDQSLALYDRVLQDDVDDDLTGYALWGRGNLLLQRQDFAPALAAFDRLLELQPAHPLARDAQLARGICLRRSGRAADAEQALEALLDEDLPPSMLGAALHEAALADIDQKAPARAAAKLERLLHSVTDYPEADKARYELAWALRDANEPEKAARQFAELSQQQPDSPLAAEAAYHVGQFEYEQQHWDEAARAYAKASRADDPNLVEKALYRLGWSHFQANRLEEARSAFDELLTREGTNSELARDARLMLAECQFKAGQYAEALAAFTNVRQSLRQPPKDAPASATQPEQLALLHGGQSALQLERYEEALQWFEQLRRWYPSTPYLAQAFYESGVCQLRLDRPDQALPLLAEVAENYRNETAARARFMIGELHFEAKDPAKAIAEFQRVMFGFGGDQAPPEIRDWQAKSGFEAGRCAELLLQRADPTKKSAAREVAIKMYRYVIDTHPEHELANKAKGRLEALTRI